MRVVKVLDWTQREEARSARSRRWSDVGHAASCIMVMSEVQLHSLDAIIWIWAVLKTEMCYSY